ncbi:MAG TPA: hypothetical protein VKF62_06535, partial [Planctomycetota bacterium]|nr:hypothetical protein [Planctomycetota bacterium]
MGRAWLFAKPASPGGLFMVDDPSRGGERVSSADLVEQLLVECLERVEEEGEGAVDSICRANPEHADALLRRFAALRASESTILGSPPEVSVPKRLGEFRLVRRIGGGGMGEVYLAEQESLKRPVAVKL